MVESFHQLSTVEPYWFRFRFPTSAARWWRKRRSLPPMPDEETRHIWPPINADQDLSREHERVEFEHVESGRFAWILSASGKRLPCIAIDLDEMEHYEIQPLYERARRKRDPTLSPHTALRLLEYGNPSDAFAYLEKFGPFWLGGSGLLPGQPSDSDAYVTAGPTMTTWLNLDLFWAAQRRFVAVAELFGAYRGDVRLSLRNAWKALVDHLDEINKVRPPLLDQLRLAVWAAPEEEPPSIADRAGLLKWLLAPDRYLRERTPNFVADELNHQVRDSKPWWRWAEGRGFVMSLSSTSLWAIIWQLFARDTLGVSWRICPHCNRLFYPSRKDRFFCTSRLQVLHSKRQWARTHRKSASKR
jgi:hypothetical protein